MKEPYDLFLDDERFPPRRRPDERGPVRDWQIARTFEDAVIFIEEWGLPRHISFDHDLGYEDKRVGGKHVLRKTGMDFAKWLVDWCIDHNWPGFSFTVHSMNPEGKRNIESLIAQYLTADPEDFKTEIKMRPNGSISASIEEFDKLVPEGGEFWIVNSSVSNRDVNKARRLKKDRSHISYTDNPRFIEYKIEDRGRDSLSLLDYNVTRDNNYNAHYLFLNEADAKAYHERTRI